MSDSLNECREIYDALCSARGAYEKHDARERFDAEAEGMVEWLIGEVDRLRASLARAEAERDALLASVPVTSVQYLRTEAARPAPVSDAAARFRARSEAAGDEPMVLASDEGEVCPSCPLKVGTCPECGGTGRAKGGDHG
jgi:hypothetical protein